MTVRESGPARRSIWIWGALFLVAGAISGVEMVEQLRRASAGDAFAEILLKFSTLPRAAVALAAGAALGLSGAILQRVLRNPLAEPATLGISAGAQLALTAATIFAPAMLEYGREGVAFAGGIVAVSIVMLLTWRRGLEPVSLLLAGMMVSLVASSFSAALVLANGEYLYSIFIWGGGALAQQNWAPALSILVALILASAIALLLVRPLSILGLDDANARSLGVAPHVMRLGILAVAVGLATTVVAEVGIIGFVGLAGPALAGLSGARTLKQRLIAAPLIGAIVLWLADGVVVLAGGAAGERIPTGAATALFGAPLLLWLLFRLRLFEQPSFAERAASRRASRPWATVAGIAAFALSLLCFTLFLGRSPTGGWAWASGAAFHDLLPWRAPRVLIAAAAGAMLGGAGALVQRMTGNPMASPEMLGASSGAGAGLAVILLLSATPSPALQFFGLIIGALVALFVMIAVVSRGDFGPERLLLAGIAIGAVATAITTAVIATGTPQAFELLRWLGGSTHSATARDATIAISLAVMLLAPLAVCGRWLDVVSLGPVAAASLGLAMNRLRLLLVLLVGLLSATASVYIGPLSFAGLIAPHLARMFGLGPSGPYLYGSIAFGALVLVSADWLARVATFPYQLPVSLMASIIGGPFLVYLLSRGGRHNG